jgi:RHS repeat-associated protein
VLRRTRIEEELVFHVYGPDGAIAHISRQTSHAPISIQYLLTDALGTVGAQASGAGALTQRHYFEPFGKRVNPNRTAYAGTVRFIKDGFTGHEHDDDLGLINIRGRAYDPWLRRMLTPDPHIPLPLGSQSWNRYSYVHNSPVTFSDPTGFDETGGYQIDLESGFVTDTAGNPITLQGEEVVVYGYPEAAIGGAMADLLNELSNALGDSSLAGQSGVDGYGYSDPGSLWTSRNSKEDVRWGTTKVEH